MDCRKIHILDGEAHEYAQYTSTDGPVGCNNEQKSLGVMQGTIKIFIHLQAEKILELM